MFVWKMIHHLVNSPWFTWRGPRNKNFLDHRICDSTDTSNPTKTSVIEITQRFLPLFRRLNGLPTSFFILPTLVVRQGATGDKRCRSASYWLSLRYLSQELALLSRFSPVASCRAANAGLKLRIYLYCDTTRPPYSLQGTTQTRTNWEKCVSPI